MASLGKISNEQVVTASDLVRHFGEWQDRAAQAPIYIMHRGRARLVMTSVSIMDRLIDTQEHNDARAPLAALAALLGASREMILLVDDRMMLTGLSRSARVHFGPGATIGATLASLTIGPACQFVCDTVERTLANGIPETIEINSDRRPGRRLSVAAEPYPDGVAVLFKDVTDEYAYADARAESCALLEAVSRTGITAVARINQRGALCAADRSLIDMTGIAGDALAGIRFSNLIEIGTRVAVSQAIEDVLTTGNAVTLDATMLVARAAPVQVQIGFSAVRRGTIVDAVLALIAKVV